MLSEQTGVLGEPELRSTAMLMAVRGIWGQVALLYQWHHTGQDVTGLAV